MPTLLGFDFGTARIGVAVGETETALAQPLETIQAQDNATRFARIEALIKEWRPASLIVGFPTSLEGEEHEMSARAKRFANQLHGRFALPVALHDERLSSAEADSLLREVGRKNWRDRKTLLDALAAQRILQSYLDNSLYNASSSNASSSIGNL